MEKVELKKTALNSTHRKLGARMVNFAGWDMPVEYSGIIDEHLAVRERAGLFDISHMGEIDVRGEGALNLMQCLTPNDVSKLSIGQAQYSAFTTAQGTFVDDILVYRLSEDHFLLCVNASNTDKDYDWMISHKFGQVQVKNVSEDYTQLSLQGPESLDVLQRLTDVDLAAIKNYWFTSGRVAGKECIISRTGYTGEDGFELYLNPEYSEFIWQKMLDAGKDVGLLPIGLGARNTLRLEARLALYGNDIDATTTVLEAGLGWIVKFGKPDFLGKEVLLWQKQHGVARTLVGFEMLGKGIARDHYPVTIQGREVGQVTSGSPAPFLKKNIGLAYLPHEFSQIGTEIEIQIRDKPVPAIIRSTPFYKRKKSS